MPSAATVDVLSATTFELTVPATRVSGKTTPAVASHLICWRSIPRARRKRRNMDAAPAATALTDNSQPTAVNTTGQAPMLSTPMGLRYAANAAVVFFQYSVEPRKT